MPRPLTDRKTAEHLEDLASRLDAGLGPTAGRPGEPIVDGLRRDLTLADWEWAALQAGQSAGSLPRVMRRLATARLERGALKRQVIGALAYPAFVLCLCTFVALVAMRVAHPPRAWMWLSVSLLAAVLLAIAWLVRRLRDPLWDGDRLPWIGRLSRGAGEIPYLVALHALYGAGVGLRTAHPQAAPAAAVPWIRARLFAATRALEAGEGLADALSRQTALTSESLALVRDGEATGQLEDALSRAITRRREEYSVGTRRSARVAGILAYVYAAGSVLWIAAEFYGGLYGRIR